jgi:hypothetical protein
MTFSAGALLGMYEILSPLGAGGMGEVSRDGERFLLYHAQEKERISESLTLIQNWPKITRGEIE